MSIQYDDMKGEKIEKIELPQFDDDSMYDIREFIANFKQLGTGMTFQQTLDFFRQASILPREEIENYVKTNNEKIYESYLRELMPYMKKDLSDILSKETIEYFLANPLVTFEELFGSEYESFCKARQMSEEEKLTKVEENMLRFKSLSQEQQAEEVESIYSDKNRNADYHYFSTYVSRLKDKGLTYLALLQFIANNSQAQQGNQHWESLLTELDINYDGTTMLGIDIKRVLSALFNSQNTLLSKLAIANDLSTYHSEYLQTNISRTEARYNEKHDNCVVYPSNNILCTLRERVDIEKPDDTSIAMSERQLKEELGIRKLLKKETAPSS